MCFSRAFKKTTKSVKMVFRFFGLGEKWMIYLHPARPSRTEKSSFQNDSTALNDLKSSRVLQQALRFFSRDSRRRLNQNIYASMSEVGCRTFPWHEIPATAKTDSGKDDVLQPCPLGHKYVLIPPRSCSSTHCLFIGLKKIEVETKHVRLSSRTPPG